VSRGRLCAEAGDTHGCERATREHPLRSSVVHPVTRPTSILPAAARAGDQYRFFRPERDARIEMIPKGSGSENSSC